MADPEKLEQNIEDLMDIDESKEEDETEDKNGKAQDTDGADNSSQKKKRSGILFRVFSFVWKLKWIGILIMLPLGALIAIGITINSRYLVKEKEKPLTLSRQTLSFDSLKEESLSPFFIPLAPDKNRRMVRVDISVIWSALASVKYKKNELQVRDQMFSHLRLFTRDNRDSNNGPDLLEHNLKGILQNSLGIYNLEVKVREINYF